MSIADTYKSEIFIFGSPEKYLVPKRENLVESYGDVYFPLGIGTYRANESHARICK
jgi:hypothetical protein